MVFIFTWRHLVWPLRWFPAFWCLKWYCTYLLCTCRKVILFFFWLNSGIWGEQALLILSYFLYLKLLWFFISVCLRVQSNPANLSDFKGISPERAFADFIFASVILHLVVMNFIGWRNKSGLQTVDIVLADKKELVDFLTITVTWYSEYLELNGIHVCIKCPIFLRQLLRPVVSPFLWGIAPHDSQKKFQGKSSFHYPPTQ